MSARQDLSIVPGFRAERAAFAWRGIGVLADLDLDFASSDPPALVTTVLANCAEPPVPVEERETIWRLSLAARVGGLLAIQAATSRRDTLPLKVYCPHADCGEGMEVALPFADLLALAQQAEGQSETEVSTSGGPLTLRRPRGTDQRLWGKEIYADAETAETAVLQSLITDGVLDESDCDVVAGVLADFDPLSCFELAVTCPECTREADVPVDLETVLLAALARVQAAMFRDVDRLARCYGWSEAEILAIPPWRRRRYLALDSDGWPE